MLSIFKQKNKVDLKSNSAYISPSVHCSGQLDFEGVVYIEGTFRGDIQSCEGELVIGSGGAVEGNIHVGSLYSSGNINGDVVVAVKAVLRNLSATSGNIKAPTLVIEEGAKIEGEVEAGEKGAAICRADVVRIENRAEAQAICVQDDMS